jgi:Holliday junction resolvasome RuvABC ATP-dependent DNA helicase subunit
MKIVNQTPAKRLLAAVSPAHVLLLGPPGYGKTTLGMAYLSQWGKPLIINGTRADRSLREITSHRGPVLVDEIHKMSKPESLYPLLDGAIQTGFRLRRTQKTLAFTTTSEGSLPGPLLSRLIQVVLRAYTTRDLAEIAQQVAPGLGVDVLTELAKFSWGSPRRVKILASLLIKTGGARHPGQVSTILSGVGYPLGLSGRLIALLEALELTPRSVNTLAGILGTDRQTISLIESDLVRAGLITIGSRGRRLTKLGMIVLGRLEELS